MNFTGLAKKRCSIRSYQDKAIEPEKLQAILEAGRLAPTGKNHQPQRLLVVQSAEGLEKVAKAMHNANAYTAKTVIIACADVDDCWIRSFDGHRIEEIDLSIVTTYMMMEATEQGLGSLWSVLIRKSCGRNSTCRRTMCRFPCCVWVMPIQRQSSRRSAMTRSANR